MTTNKRRISQKAELRNAKKQRIQNAYNRVATVTVIPALSPFSGDENRKLRVAAYCRVSTDSEMQATSFELQRQEYEEKIKKEDKWEFAGIYADEGISGTSAEKRIGLQQLMKDCRAGKIDLILIKNVSRFMRNSEQCSAYTRELSYLDPPVGIVFETENIDTRKPGYELQLALYSVFAQAESENKSQSIKWSNERRWNKGIIACNTDQFFGYAKDENGEMVIVPEEARIIRSIYRLYRSGKNVRQISEWLSVKRIPTFYGNETWSQTSVRNILRNEVYCGDLIRPKTYKKDFLSRKVIRNTGKNRGRKSFYQQGHHPAIIPRAEWDDVQEQLQYRRFARESHRKALRIRQMPGTLGSFYLFNPDWDGYDLARVKEKLFPPPKTNEEILEEKRILECKPLI
jgi:DNA invertase Pin-like site-specific DNA recombinase